VGYSEEMQGAGWSS